MAPMGPVPVIRAHGEKWAGAGCCPVISVENRPRAVACRVHGRGYYLNYLGGGR